MLDLIEASSVTNKTLQVEKHTRVFPLPTSDILSVLKFPWDGAGARGAEFFQARVGSVSASIFTVEIPDSFLWPQRNRHSSEHRF